MYLALLALLVAAVAGSCATLAGVAWLGSVLWGLAAFVATWIIGVKRIGRRLNPLVEQAQRQIAAGSVQPAIATLEQALALGNWLPLLKGQIQAQLGFLTYQAGNRDAAIAWLTKAGRRAGDARLLLASLLAKDGKEAESLQLLNDSLPWNRKHVLLHNTYAWLLHRKGRRNDALDVLNRLLAKVADDATADNRRRLQNDQRLNMASFGMPWYALGFERPPASMGTMRSAPKGFREAPRRRRGG